MNGEVQRCVACGQPFIAPRLRRYCRTYRCDRQRDNARRKTKDYRARNRQIARVRQRTRNARLRAARETERAHHATMEQVVTTLVEAVQ